MGEEGNQVPHTVGAAHAKKDRAEHVGTMGSLWPEQKEREATEEVGGAGLAVGRLPEG